MLFGEVAGPTSGVGTCVVAFVPAMVVGGLKQRRVEAYFDVRTEHDFTALTRDTRNTLDNPTSALDLLDLPFLFCRSILSPRDVF